MSVTITVMNIMSMTKKYRSFSDMDTYTSQLFLL